MPKLPRSPEEKEAIRQKILDYALDIIGNDGYDGLTMRRLGDSLGFAAKTLYNYYSGKEEIYLLVLTRGFEILYQRVEQAAASSSHPIEKLRSIIKAYVKFGTQNPNYYNIMFNWDVPKYLDYAGTLLEPTARHEKDTAFRFAAVVEHIIGEIQEQYETFPAGDTEYRLLQLWSSIHGIVSLYNSRGMHELISRTDEATERLIHDIVKTFSHGT